VIGHNNTENSVRYDKTWLVITAVTSWISVHAVDFTEYSFKSLKISRDVKNIYFSAVIV